MTRIDVYDVFFVAGCVALVVGVAQVSIPAAWMLTGAILIAIAVWPLRKARS